MANLDTNTDRYGIDFDKLVGQLVPHWLRGRKLVLLLQSCVFPLARLNQIFKTWAITTRTRMSMTSQVILLQNYLNLECACIGITIDVKASFDTACYHEDVPNSIDKKDLVFYSETEGIGTPIQCRQDGDEASFIVNVPARIAENASKLETIRAILDRYKITNKTYKISIV